MMKKYIFYPHSFEYVKNKARQLKNAFPGMKTSLAQETTAQALGFESLFDCHSRIGTDAPSGSQLYNHQLTREKFLERRHFQFCKLVDTGIIPCSDAEVFVRAWGLTEEDNGRDIRHYASDYTEFFPLTQEDNPDFYSETLAEGLILAHDIKNSFYMFDHAQYNKLPTCIRGNSACYLRYENYLHYADILPKHLKEEIARENESHFRFYATSPFISSIVKAEWLGEPVDRPLLNKFMATSDNNPYKRYALSIRHSCSGNNFKKTWRYVPTLSGTDFKRFLLSKGEYKVSDVIWYKVPIEDIASFFSAFDFANHDGPFSFEPVRYEQCTPLYNSPFKHGPMADIEYDWMVEGAGLEYSEEFDFTEYE